MVSQYADFYFEYDDQRRVTRESVNGGSQTYQFSYSQSSHADAYNAWKYKTVETLPDGNQNIVYSNYAGQTMLLVFKSGSDQWCEFWKYNDDGQVVLHANPSAVSGYDEQYADLLHEVSGNYQYLRDSDGLIHTFEYHAASGYLTAEKIQHGETGTPIKLREYEYLTVPLFPSFEQFLVQQRPPAVPRAVSAEPQRTGRVLPEQGNRLPVGHGPDQEADHHLRLHVPCRHVPGAAEDHHAAGRAHRAERLRRGRHAQGSVRHVRQPDLDHGRAGLHHAAEVRRGDRGRDAADRRRGHGSGQRRAGGLGNADRRRAAPGHAISSTTTRAASRRRSARCTRWTSAARRPASGGRPGPCTTTPNHEVRTAEAATPDGDELQHVHPDQPRLDHQVRRSGQRAGADPGHARLDQPASCKPATRSPSRPTSPGRRTSTRECCVLDSTRVYHTIPASGEGQSGTHYDQTDFEYKTAQIMNRQKTPGGTITFTVFDARGNPTKVYVGTDDTGATVGDPTGGGAQGNNMVLVTENEYDGGSAGGDGNLTQADPARGRQHHARDQFHLRLAEPPHRHGRRNRLLREGLLRQPGSRDENRALRHHGQRQPDRPQRDQVRRPRPGVPDDPVRREPVHRRGGQLADRQHVVRRGRERHQEPAVRREALHQDRLRRPGPAHQAVARLRPGRDGLQRSLHAVGRHAPGPDRVHATTPRAT